MELGALVCIPGTPHCEECPLADLCRGYAAGPGGPAACEARAQGQGKVPVTVALIESEQGLLLQRRPARGLLAGLWQPAAWEKALTRDELTAALAASVYRPRWTCPCPPQSTYYAQDLGTRRLARHRPRLCSARRVCLLRRRIWQRSTPCRMRSGRM